jgi:hypothetical protein
MMIVSVDNDYGMSFRVVIMTAVVMNRGHNNDPGVVIVMIIIIGDRQSIGSQNQNSQQNLE